MQASDLLLQLRDTSAATSRAPVPPSVLLEPALAPPSSHSDWGHLLVPDYSQLLGTGKVSGHGGILGMVLPLHLSQRIPPCRVPVRSLLIDSCL